MRRKKKRNKISTKHLYAKYKRNQEEEEENKMAERRSKKETKKGMNKGTKISKGHFIYIYLYEYCSSIVLFSLLIRSHFNFV